MNDFTKEELDDLEEYLSDMPEFFDTSDGIIFKLHDKVKSMIENYCEHDDLKDVGKGYKVCRSCGVEIYE